MIEVLGNLFFFLELEGVQILSRKSLKKIKIKNNNWITHWSG